MWKHFVKFYNEKNLTQNLIFSGLLSWITVFLLIGGPMQSFTLDHTRQQNFGLTLVMIGLCFILYFLFGFFQTRIQHAILVPLLMVMGILCVFYNNAPWIAAGFTLMTVLALYYVREDIFYYIEKFQFRGNGLQLFFIALGVFLFAYIGITTSLRYFTFTSSDQDLGIFTQMFESMKNTGRQITTVERNMPMSHFQVHISPVFYLLLPVYYLFPHAITLQLAQAFLTALALWPLYLLCRHYHLSSKAAAAIGILYCFYPALSGSCLNDFHENCFLPLFLLVLIYVTETRKNILFFLFMVLTLSIKEDVAVMLMILGIFFMLSKKDWKKGAILFGTSAVYFLVALFLLSGYGQGVLGYMGNLYLNQDGGALQVIQTILMNPGYTLRQCFDTPEKIEYMLWTLLPFSIALIADRKFSRYLLLLPYLLFNLIPDYAPVYSIYNQYHFAVTVFLMYLTIMNLSEWTAQKQRNFLLTACCIVVMLFSTSVLQRTIYQSKQYWDEHEKFLHVESILKQIPRELSVGTTARFSPHLARRNELYGVYAGTPQIIIVNLEEEFYTDLQEVRSVTQEKGYHEVYLEEGVLAIFERN